ncbi:MAG TPA: adenylyl-sulfate kinase [Desulfomonilaceae bacterium]|nr:adenylyl-sulfate kinase [Desulfomonilaceae bacterium]
MNLNDKQLTLQTLLTAGSEEREKLLKQRGCVVWLTGLSASGKTTIATALEQRLLRSGWLAYVLDGDNLRQGLCSDLGYSREERKENIRRVSAVAALFTNAGLIAIAAFISPFRDDRAMARKNCQTERFLEVYLKTPLEVCEQRDPKQMYKKARAGIISDFTGISAPYEPPEAAELSLDTSQNSVSECIGQLERLLLEKGFLQRTAVETVDRLPAGEAPPLSSFESGSVSGFKGGK